MAHTSHLVCAGDVNLLNETINTADKNTKLY